MNVRRRRGFLGALGIVVVFVAAACGVAAPQPKAPPPPENADYGGSPGSATPSPARQPAPPQAYPPPPPLPASPAGSAPPADAPTTSVEPADSNRRRQAALRTARAEVEIAQRELESGQGECTTACRALGSMERATGHLCDLATETEDRRRCEDAKTLVQRARDRVRAACGTCPDGPLLDRRAPIPSRP